MTQGRRDTQPQSILKSFWRDDDDADVVLRAAQTPLMTTGTFPQIQAQKVCPLLAPDSASSKLLAMGVNLSLDGLRFPASERCCSTSSTSARSMPIWGLPWRSTASAACGMTCACCLCRRRSDPTIALAPLYGAIGMKGQDLALTPAPKDLRKVVLATSIAETSVMIEGVRVVIDSGLARVPRFGPDGGVTRLETVRVSRAAADQRRGRAGRTEPGVCFRLWDEPQTQSLPAFVEPEIRSADLAALLLACTEWGTTDPLSLSWIDPPPAAAINAAREELIELEALDARGSITAMGRRLRALPLPPRLVRMVIVAGEFGRAEEAAEIAAVMVERGLGGNDPDLAYRLEGFRRDRARRASEMRKLAVGWARMASAGRSVQKPRADMSIARMLALAFPERIGKSRGAPGQFLLANGRGANLDSTYPLARSPFLVAAELSGSAGSTRILLAAAANEADIFAAAGHRTSARMTRSSSIKAQVR
jgi:ATP-dependent helicase HrpB